MRRWPLLVLVASLLGGAALWYLQTSGSAVEQPSAAGPHQGSLPAPPAARDPLRDDPGPRRTGPALIRGTVSDGRGRIAGASVFAVRADEEENLSELEGGTGCDGDILSCDSDAAATLVAQWAQARRGEAAVAARAVSDAHGEFVLEGLAPGLHRLWATAEGQGAALALEVPAGELAAKVVFDRQVEVTGTVTDANARPLAGVAVTGFLPHAPRYFSAQTGADGTFNLGKFSSGDFVVTATGSGQLTDFHHETLEPPATTFELVLAPSDVHRVQVLFQGQPAKGALVSIRGHQGVAPAPTDARGEVMVVLPRRADFVLTATAGSLAGELAVEPRHLTAAPLVITLSPAIWISGVVRAEDRSPVAGAEIDTDRDSETMRTDVGGHFRVGPLKRPEGPSESATVSARARGYASASREVQLRSDQEPSIELVLTAGQTVSGRVLSRAGVPIEGAQLVAVGVGRSEWSATLGDPTGPDGAFSFEDVPAGRLKLKATHDDWLPGELEVSAPATRVELRLSPGAEIAVTVVDERGAPLSMVVDLKPERDDDDDSGADLERSKEADLEGHCSFKGVAPGRWLVVTSAPDDTLMPASSTVAVVGSGRHAVRLVMKAGLTIEGQVTDEAGRPLAEVELLALQRSDDGRQRDSSSDASTDARGHFQLRGLLPGKYELHVSSEHSNRETVANAGDTSVLITLPVKQVLVGRVVDERGQAVTRFRVDAEVISSATGEFRTSKRESQTEIRVYADGLAPREVTLPEDRLSPEINLGAVALSRGRTVRVLVVTKEGGRPVAGATVSALKHQTVELEQQLEQRTDSDGAATLVGLPETAVYVSVVANGYRTASASARPGESELRLQLEQAGSVEGRLWLSDGSPAPGATITLSCYAPREGPPPPAPTGNPQLDAMRMKMFEVQRQLLERAWRDGRTASATGTADATGAFQVGGLRAGPWEATVDFGPGHSKPPSLPFSVTLGRATHLDVREPAGGRPVEFAFVDARGKPVDDLSAVLAPGVVSPPELMRAFVSLSRRGFRLDGDEPVVVAPGVYSAVGVVAEAPFSVRVEVTDRSPRTLTVVVPPNLTPFKE